MEANPVWYREEYKARISEIRDQLTREQNLLSYSLVALAGITAFLGSGHQLLNNWMCPVVTAAGLLFLAMAIHFMRHDLFIAYNAQYIERFVRLRAPDLPGGSLAWESFVASKRGKGGANWRLHRVLALSRLGVILLPSLGFVSLGCHFMSRGTVKDAASAVSWGLFVLFAIGLATLCWLIRLVRKEAEELAAISKEERPESGPGPGVRS